MNDMAPLESSRLEALGQAGAAVEAARAYTRCVQRLCHAAVTRDGRIDPAAVELRQRQVHGFAWVATAVEGLAQLASWAARLDAVGRWDEGGDLVLRIGFGEYLAQLLGGLPMGQNELVRPMDLQAQAEAADLAAHPAVRWFLKHGNTQGTRADLGRRLAEGWPARRCPGGRDPRHGPGPVPRLHRRAHRPARPWLAPGRCADPRRARG